MKIKLQTCLRCQGDLFLDDFDHEYRCLQCGCEVTLEKLERSMTLLLGIERRRKHSLIEAKSQPKLG
jgi:hypothetical protein